MTPYKTLRNTLLATSVFAVLALTPATAQTVESLQQDIKDLKADLRDFKKVTLGNSTTNSTINRVADRTTRDVFERVDKLSADLFAKVGEAETMTQEISVRLEDIEGQLKQTADQTEKRAKDTEFRFQSLQDDIKKLREFVKTAEKLTALSKQVATVAQDLKSTQTTLSAQQALIDAQTNMINKQGKALENALKQVAQITEQTAQTGKQIQSYAQQMETLQKNVSQLQTTPPKQGEKSAEKSAQKPPEKPKTEPKKPNTKTTKKSAPTPNLTVDADSVKKQAVKKATEQANKPKPQFKTSAEHYKKAVDAMGKQKFDQARELFDSFIKIYPTDQSVDDAKYYLAGLLVDAGKPADGAKLYMDIYENHSNSNRLSGALLKLARLYQTAEQTQTACEILDILDDSYQDKDVSKAIQRDLTRGKALHTEYKCS